ncbi:site-specific integrase [Desulfuromonas sp. CSMB_57]|uniref:tyrosine-type recombinase/integrase n=1 Tax=Desulfuromonas sp. CSMB_57 TaxID=2807629 RepID=UPI001CD7BBD2|nr:site-specific integrase [Desulfuromonas sp. CSMB_57]
MPVKWKASASPGVRYYEHPERKHGINPDRYFSIRYQHKGKRVEEGLGWASEGWTDKLANEKLVELKRAARLGEGDRSLREKREKQQAQELERQERERQDITVDRLIAEYVERYAKRHKVRWEEDERALKKDVSPEWGQRKVKDIRRADVVRLLEGIVARGAPVQACNILEKCRKMFNLAMTWGHIESNPFAGQPRPAPRPERDRVLSNAEIKTLWEALDSENIVMSAPLRLAFKLILVTGQRPGEVIGMHRREIDGRWWIIPKERTKTRRSAHRVYLSDLAMELLGEGEGYLFPSPAGGKPIAENALALSLRRNILGKNVVKKTKGLAGRKRHYAARKAEMPVVINRIGVDHFVPHDLRRTFLTGLARLRVAFEVRERIVNHSLGKLERTYNQHDYDREKMAAMQRWSEELQRILQGQVAKVINIEA